MKTRPSDEVGFWARGELLHGTSLETPRFPLKGSLNGDMGPCKGLYQDILGVLGGSWGLVITCNWAHKPTYKWAKLCKST